MDAPEALMYEPDSNGELQLVGVEYVVPKDADAWTPGTAGLGVAGPGRRRRRT